MQKTKHKKLSPDESILEALNFTNNFKALQVSLQLSYSHLLSQVPKIKGNSSSVRQNPKPKYQKPMSTPITHQHSNTQIQPQQSRGELDSNRRLPKPNEPFQHIESEVDLFESQYHRVDRRESDLAAFNQQMTLQNLLQRTQINRFNTSPIHLLKDSDRHYSILRGSEESLLLKKAQQQSFNYTTVNPTGAQIAPKSSRGKKSKFQTISKKKQNASSNTIAKSNYSEQIFQERHRLPTHIEPQRRQPFKDIIIDDDIPKKPSQEAESASMNLNPISLKQGLKEKEEPEGSVDIGSQTTVDLQVEYHRQTCELQPEKLHKLMAVEQNPYKELILRNYYKGKK